MYTIFDTSSDEACSVNSIGGFRGCIADYLHVLGHTRTPLWAYTGRCQQGWLVASNYNVGIRLRNDSPSNLKISYLGFT